MRITEIYSSRQGEGLLTGTPSVFVRTTGCNLRCKFCDTPYTSWNPEGEHLSVDQIVQSVLTFGVQHIVVTGGEPMLPFEITELTECLSSANRHITIETAGTVVRDVHCDLYSISPKLSNSTPERSRAGAWHQRHEAKRLNINAIHVLMARSEYQLKFVVESPGDLEEVINLVEQLQADRQRVLLMPEGVAHTVLNERIAWLGPLCDELGFRLCPRMHIEWYGNQRGT